MYTPWAQRGDLDPAHNSEDDIRWNRRIRPWDFCGWGEAIPWKTASILLLDVVRLFSLVCLFSLVS